MVKPSNPVIPVFSFINIMFFYTNMEGGNIRIIPIIIFMSFF